MNAIYEESNRFKGMEDQKFNMRFVCMYFNEKYAPCAILRSNAFNFHRLPQTEPTYVSSFKQTVCNIEDYQPHQAYKQGL